jgi:hypothetical protein
MRSTLKLLVNRLLYNLGIGIFFGTAMKSADPVGVALPLAGMFLGYFLNK